ncbi:hypothetical protein Aduo_000750 [Ancylostoma duodenale]
MKDDILLSGNCSTTIESCLDSGHDFHSFRCLRQRHLYFGPGPVANGTFRITRGTIRMPQDATWALFPRSVDINTAHLFKWALIRHSLRHVRIRLTSPQAHASRCRRSESPQSAKDVRLPPAISNQIVRPIRSPLTTIKEHRV